MSERDNNTNEPDPTRVFPDEFLTLPEAARELPSLNGKRLGAPTLWRWCRRGINGVTLDYWRIGRSIVVTRKALAEFFQALAKADKPLPEKPKPQFDLPSVRRKNQIRQRQIERAHRMLRNMGV